MATTREREKTYFAHNSDGGFVAHMLTSSSSSCNFHKQKKTKNLSCGQGQLEQKISSAKTVPVQQQSQPAA